jgi:Tfp pilus assembly PilM family ATPase
VKWFQKSTSVSELVGLAIEDDGLAAVIVNWVDGVIRIEQLDFFESSGGETRAALKRWVGEKNLDGVRCYLVASPDQVATYQIDRPPVEANELEEAVRWRVKDSIDFDVEEAVVDVFDFPEDALRGRKPILNVAVARKSVVRDLVEMVRGSGLDLKAIDIPDMALRNIVSTYAEEGRSIAMLVLDKATGHVSLYKNDLLYLSRQININPSVFGDSGDKVNEERGLDQLCLEIQRSLDYFESQLNQVAPKKILIYTTRGAQRLHAAITDNLSVDATILDLNRFGIEVGNRELDLEERVSSVRAVGAALRQELA